MPRLETNISQDPWTKCVGYKEYTAQWFSLVSFSVVCKRALTCAAEGCRPVHHGSIPCLVLDSPSTPNRSRPNPAIHSTLHQAEKGKTAISRAFVPDKFADH